MTDRRRARVPRSRQRPVAARLDPAAALADVARLLAQAAGPEVVAQRIADRIRELLAIENSVVYRLDPASEDLCGLASSGDVGPLFRENLVFARGLGAIGLAVRERRPYASPNVLHDRRVALSPDLRSRIERAPYRAVLALPLLFEQRVVGGLAVGGRAGRRFTRGEIALAQAFADQAAIALEAASVQADQRLRLARMRTLTRLNQVIGSSLGVNEVLQEIVNAAAVLMDAPFTSLWMVDPEAQVLRLGTANDQAAMQTFPASTLEFGEGAVGWIAVHRQLLQAPDALADPRIAGADWWRAQGLSSYLGLPVMVDGEPIAVLSLCGTRPFALTGEDEELLQSFVASAAVTIRKAKLYDDADRRRREAEALAATGRALAATLDPDTVLDLVADRVCALLGTQRSAVALVDPDNVERFARFAAVRGLSPRYREFAPSHPHDGTTATAIIERRAVWSADLLADPAFDLSPATRAFVEAEGYRAVLSTPLLVGERVLGALVTYRDTPGPFTSRQMALLEAFADQAALALEGAGLYEEAQRRRREAEVLDELARTINAALDLDTVLIRLAEGARELCRADIARIALAEPGATGLTVRHRVGARTAGPARVEPGRGVGGRVVLTGRPFRTSHYLEDPRVGDDYRQEAQAEGIVATLAVPIRIGERAEGVLYVDNRSPRPFTDRDEAILLRLADHAAVAIQNARLFAETTERRRSAETLAEHARALAETLDPGVVAQRTVDHIRPLLGTVNSSLYQLDPTSGDLVATAFSGDVGPGFIRGLRVPRGGATMGVAIAERRAVSTADILADPGIRIDAGTRQLLESAPHRAVLSVPMFVEDRVVGALSVGDRAGRTFGPDDVQLMQTFAASAALALENARLHMETERRRHEAEVLAELTRTINTSLDPDTVLLRIAEGARELCRSDLAFVSLRTPDTAELRFRHWPGARWPGYASFSIETGKGVSGLVLATARPFRTDDYVADPRVSADYHTFVREEGIVAVLAVPILIDGRVEGILSVDNRVAQSFTDGDEAVLVRLAEHAAVALRNAQLFAAQQASERRYRRLFEGANDPIATFALDGTIASVNAAVERALGYTAPEMTGRHYSEFLDPSSLARVQERVERTLAGERIPPTVEVAVLRKDGRLLPAEGQTSVIRDDQGRATGWQVIYRDLTERKQAEEALRASEERYRTLVEHSVQGVHIHRDWITLFCNGPLARMMGFEHPDELLGMDVRRFIAPRELLRLEGYRKARLRGEPAPLRYEFEGVRKDGTPIWLEIAVSTTTWEGTPATLSTLYDVTERRRAEEALGRSEEQLRQAQKMEAVGRLAGGIAHDFNNLLTVIGGRAELLLRMPADDRTRRDLELIRSTAERAAALTQQLLAFSRKQVLQPRVLQLNAVVDGIVRMLERLIGENIDLVTSLDGAAGRVRADRAQIEQVIVNLALNARDAMPGGGRLTIATADSEIGEDARPGLAPGPYVTLTVADTGVGMSPEVRAHIFEPFFTTKEPGRGTGLGLATVYGILKQHGGDVEVQSAPGTGTTVTIYLPRVVADPDRESVRPAPPAQPGAAETVLVVEDQDDVRELMTEILGERGYHVLSAASAVDALEVARRHGGPIDLLLTDVVMPGMSGRDLATRLTAEQPGVRVLYVSGYTDDAIVGQVRLERGAALLPKPFSTETLVAKVAELLAGRPGRPRAAGAVGD